MRNRRWVLILATALLMALTGLSLLVSSAPREPTYKGLTIAQWLSAPKTPSQEEAIAILGTNNLHLLVQRVNYEPKKDRGLALYSRLPAPLRNDQLLTDILTKNFTSARAAQRLLHRLGLRAAPAVPELARLARNAGQPVALNALIILVDIGEPAIPGIIAGMSNTNQIVRTLALSNLGPYSNSPAAWHAITNALTDPDPRMRSIASRMISSQPTE